MLGFACPKIISHDRQQRQYLDEMMMEAMDYLSQLQPEEGNFDASKAEFMRRTA